MKLNNLIFPIILLCVAFGLYSLVFADSRDVFYESDGVTVQSRGKFNEKGQGVGIHTYYYPNGEKSYEMEFNENGALDGQYKNWDENGRLFQISTHSNGKKHGDFKRWDAQNNLIIHEVYENDSLTKILVER